MFKPDKHVPKDRKTMPTDVHSMTAAEFRAIIKRLGFSSDTDNAGGAAVDEGISATARFFGVHPRTGRAWGKDGPSAPVALCLRLMEAAKITADDAQKLLARRRR